MENDKLYNVIVSPIFMNELNRILEYISRRLIEPKIAKRFYQKVKQKINLLENFPEIYPRFIINKQEFRRIIIKNYVIIYKINSITRRSFYSTYFPWKSKLFFPDLKNISKI